MPMMTDEILEMPASAKPQVHDLLRRRWSPRAFAQRDLRTRETAVRTRKPLEEVVFSGRWGHTSPLAA
jgi:hypothetical protein